MSASIVSDFLAIFQIDGRAVRGRAVRMGAQSLSTILDRHDYPPHIARLLGEAVTLAALVGASLKFEGRLIVQAEGNGPVTLLVGEYRTDGSVRGYARFDAEGWARLDRLNRGAAPHMPQLFGPDGRLGLILIQDSESQSPYQGIVPLERATLAECAEDYFDNSEQVPTELKLTVAQLERKGEAPTWISGGMMVQKVAGDDARGDTDEDWREARALFATLSDAELADPNLPIETLLFRLFHEQGVRIEDRQALADRCTCNQERLVATLQSMPDASLRELVEPDGTLAIDCQFCGRHYAVPIDVVTAQPN